MIRDIDMVLRPEEGTGETVLAKAASRKLHVSPRDIQAVTIIRRSIDARRSDVKINVRARVYIGESPEIRNPVVYQDVSSAPDAVVVGAGPAGLFAALSLIECGIRPVVLERGKE